MQFLKAQNIDKIDYFILTHCDEDHIGGAYKVLDELKIGTLYMPSKENDTQTYERLLKASDGTEINIEPLKYNLDGTGRKQATFFERKYWLAFFF